MKNNWDNWDDEEPEPQKDFYDCDDVARNYVKIEEN